MLNCAACGGKKFFSLIDPKTGLQVVHHRTVAGYEYDLRVWRCYRCGTVQEEVPPVIPETCRTGANILYIDLEVSKSMLFNYGLKVPSGFIHPDNLVHEYYIICWSASYVGSDRVWSGCVTPEMAQNWTDKEILKPLRDLVASADIVAGHNVDKFDMRRLNTRLLLNGLEPVTNKKTMDTLRVARSKFAFESNGLDYISQRLGFRPKDDIRQDDWLRIVKSGDRRTLRKVNKYCKGDVTNGKSVLEVLMKYSGKKVSYGATALESPLLWRKEMCDER